ncbi:MAG: hypothetical protein L0332_31460 [Chloroflexi bacterium]|nr:hypothetical protein [Chloroflexota bacterium]MCI0649674.1 hypothetical protein [Chloroflexota bacterium]MCI0731220.1 hypothetical protein [Chloroflexota bacterium]
MVKIKLANISKRRLALIILVVLWWILFINEKLEVISRLPSDGECIASFDHFVFTFPDIDGPTQEEILPLPPWQVVSVVPEESSDGRFEVVAIRPVGKNFEVWLSDSAKNGNDFFLVYRPDLQEWQQIVPQIPNSSTKVERLYAYKGQSIWGISLEVNPNFAEASGIVFTIFDDVSKSFVVQHTQKFLQQWKLRTKSQDGTVAELGEIVLDSNGIFWIFSASDAIYSFDPVNQQAERHASLAEYNSLFDLIYDPNGRLFFYDYDGGVGSVFQYTISTNNIAKIPPPHNTFYSGSLLDHAGNLWLRDGYGWRTPEGVWQRLHPDPIKYWWYLAIPSPK